jgi:hypothetical protein
MWIHSERYASPRPGKRFWPSLAALHWCQAERSGKRFWDAAQSDGHLPSCGNASIASQPLLKRQPRVRPLRTGQRRRWERWSGRKTLYYPHLHALVTKKLQTCPPMLPAAPILPEDGFRPDDQWMQEHTHLRRLRSGVPLPLALFAQRTRAATTDASRIDDTQAPIGLSASLMDTKLLTCWTVKRAIRLEDKILPREAACASSAERLLPARTPEQEPAWDSPCVEMGAREQTRWCAPGQDEADGPTPDGGSRSIG